MKAICRWCHEDFERFNVPRQYCSKECRTNGVKRIKRKNLNSLPIPCKSCKNEFVPTQSHQIYCSNKCLKEIKRKESKFCHFSLFQRDGFKCVYCGKSSIKHGAELVVDHIFPRSLGGKNDLFNLITACKRCNDRKSNKYLGDQLVLELWGIVEKRSRKINQLDYERLVGFFNKPYKEAATPRKKKIKLKKM